MRPQLTNKQRAYLGLRPVLPHWQASEWLPDTVFYHDEAAVYKIVSYAPTIRPDWFKEADYAIALTPDGLLLPKSGRGKPRAITAANLLKYVPTGCQFWYDGADRFLAEAPHYAFIPVKGRGSYGSWAAVAAWLDGWLARQPADLPQHWVARLAAPLPAVAYRAGDVAAFALSNGAGYGFCRILLDANKLNNAGYVHNPPAETGGLHYLRRRVTPLLFAEVLQLQKSEPTLTAEELANTLRYPPLLLSDGGIYKGGLPIVAHQPVKAEQLVQLPEAFDPLYGLGPRGFYYQWGIAAAVVPFDDRLETELNLLRKEFPRRNPLNDFQVESAFINPESYFPVCSAEAQVPAYDMRHPRYQELRARIFQLLDLPADCSYDEFSRRFGYPTRQELLALQEALPFHRGKWPKWWG